MASTPLEKQCNSCKQIKLLEEFYISKDNKSTGRKSICAVCERKRTEKWRLENKEKDTKNRREYHLKRKYSLDLSEYNKLMIEQNHKCAICNKDELECKFQKLYVDHCHTTGKIRKLLCHHCNTGLGMFIDDPELLRVAALYLEDN